MKKEVIVGTNNKEKMMVALINVVLLMIVVFRVEAVGGDTRPFEFKYADRTLNMVYKEIFDKLSPDEQVKLKNSQRKWIIFKDLDCAWAYAFEPYNCLIDRTENRTKDLLETYFFDRDHNYISIKIKQNRYFLEELGS